MTIAVDWDFKNQTKQTILFAKVSIYVYTGYKRLLVNMSCSAETPGSMHLVSLFFQAQGGIQYMQTLFLLLITMSRSEKVSELFTRLLTL